MRPRLYVALRASNVPFGHLTELGAAALGILGMLDGARLRDVQLKWFGKTSPAYLVGSVVSLLLVLYWFFTRHSFYSFLLQDLFGLCVCCIFLLQIRLDSIKVGGVPVHRNSVAMPPRRWLSEDVVLSPSHAAARSFEQVAVVLLVMFFLYDIFMVFISPAVFKSSVMMDVATAGQPTPIEDQACYCRLNPGRVHYGKRNSGARVPHVPVTLRPPSPVSPRPDRRHKALRSRGKHADSAQDAALHGLQVLLSSL